MLASRFDPYHQAGGNLNLKILLKDRCLLLSFDPYHRTGGNLNLKTLLQDRCMLLSFILIIEQVETLI